MPEQNPQKQSAANQPSEPTNEPITPQSTVSFPVGMLAVAALFDLVGWIPILNFFTETLSGLILGFWQKLYMEEASLAEIVLAFISAKSIKAASVGFGPTNCGIVLFTYFRKKAMSKIKKATGLSLPQAA
ncbi:MAG: hypothetical protein LiPW39_332 [Parcubacteria group bacterium LiPW_39]|nr:MAG: hypothetical protein LiPW39_332 [Parcubacteria group bacterium LiPW_39]